MMGLFSKNNGLTVEVKMKKFQLRILSKAHIKAFEMTAEALKTEINLNEVTPKQTGTLEKSLKIETGGLNRGKIKIMYDTPYARRLYYHPEYNFRTDKNRNAKGLWLDDLLTGDNQDFVEKTYNEFYRKITKGVLK